jgi:F0F1-type ATP synthase membrane subunit c/vacuolar-type H+-ATPase subunit K
MDLEEIEKLIEQKLAGAPRTRVKGPGFGAYIKTVVQTLCDRPDHLQRLAIIGAGMVAYPMVCAIIWIVWKGYDHTPELQAQSLNFMGFALYGAMVMWGLVVVALLGVVKGLKVEGPGGVSVELTTTATATSTDAPPPNPEPKDV